VMRYQLRYIRIRTSGGFPASVVRDRTLADAR